MKYDTYLLDLDETIFNFNKAEKSVIKAVFEENELPFDELIYKRYHTINKNLWKRYERAEIQRDDIFKTRFSSLFKEYKIELKKDLNEHFFSKMKTKYYLFEGAENFLKYLADNGRIYAATNGRDEIQKSRLIRSKIKKYFKGVFISENIGVSKPDVRFFNYIANNIPCFDKKRTVMIGDSLTSDILGGINFGIDTIWLKNQGEELIKDIKPTYIAKNYAEIKEIIGSR